MRMLAWVLWFITLIWIVLALFGAFNFQELYGATSGLQAFLLAFVIGLVPASIGWWAYRRSKRASA
ncbi:MAG: hypothetical protein V3S26_00205 [Acidimicrobiia bacterium]